MEHEPMHPTVDRGLAHKHPDDRDEIADTLTAVVTTGAAFSSRHRIITTTGATRHVLVVGDQLHDQHGLVVGTSGYYIDLTDAVAADRRHTVTTELPELLATRAAIEQAKGALMAVYGVTAEQAFAVLELRSQEPTPNCAPWPNASSTRSPTSVARRRRPAPGSITCCSPPTGSRHAPADRTRPESTSFGPAYRRHRGVAGRWEPAAA
ncbi:ANTAR domain-containing protein [Nocardia takedensis]|uniref:ANTAR domain-containing protein n=1 Tax=Nocardia takedensis TaxID=259390 RepID=UPI0012F65B11|nr:ANTAR domain-containing protein [Nocardia takedensis]